MKKNLFYLALFIGIYFGMQSPLSAIGSTNLSSNSKCVPQPDSVTVYVFFRLDCKICEYYTNELSALAEKFQKQDSPIGFLILYPNTRDKRKQIEHFNTTYDFHLPYKTDHFKGKTKQFEAQVSPEVVVYNERKKEVIYQGRIDNTFFNLGKRRTVTTTHELEKVLLQVSQKNYTPIPSQKAIGCFID